MTSRLDQLVSEFEAAARRLTVLQRHWDQMVLLEPLRPGDDVPTVTREQLALEDEIPLSWDGYIEKRKARR